MKALVIDDDPALLTLVRKWLERAGYEVFTSLDFGDARAKLKEHRVDLIVADIRLGEYNGLQLAARARQSDADTNIVMMSGWSDDVLKAEAARLGAVFLDKPFTEFEFSTAIGVQPENRPCAP
jgi:two-component system, NtrC family, response regulator HydG